MVARMNVFGYDRGIAMFADWTERINAGEVPPAPPRPQGIERNVVLTLWDIAGPKIVPAFRGFHEPLEPPREHEWPGL